MKKQEEKSTFHPYTAMFFFGISVKLTATVLNFGSQDDAVTVPAAVAETPLKSHSGEVSVR